MLQFISIGSNSLTVLYSITTLGLLSMLQREENSSIVLDAWQCVGYTLIISDGF